MHETGSNQFCLEQILPKIAMVMPRMTRIPPIVTTLQACHRQEVVTLPSVLKLANRTSAGPNEQWGWSRGGTIWNLLKKLESGGSREVEWPHVHAKCASPRSGGPQFKSGQSNLFQFFNFISAFLSWVYIRREVNR